MMGTPSPASYDHISALLSSAEKDATPTKELTISIGSCVDALEKEELTLNNFTLFLSTVHDHFAKCDSAVRSVLLRAIRKGLLNQERCDLLIHYEYHYIVVVSLELEADYIWERMQALKIMKRYVEISAASIPTAFVRSLIAVSSQKEDNFRRVSLECLRELATKNAKIVADCGGFKVLFDAILDVGTKELAEPILISMLFLLNNSASRKYIRPYIDIQTLLSPFTDLDSTVADIEPKRQLAKNALIIMLRSWAGIVELTSDDMGLAALTRMLSDNNVSVVVKEMLLDCFAEVCDPLIATLEFQKRYFTSHIIEASKSDLLAATDIEPPPPPPAVTPTTTRFDRSGSLQKYRMDSLNNVTLGSLVNDGEERLSSHLPPTTPSAAKRANPKRLSVWTRYTTHAELAEKITVDPMYNLLDHYAGLLCCAFIHVHLFDSLWWLATHSTAPLSQKTEELFISLLGIVSRIFPERICSVLLTVPTLIDFAASSASTRVPDRALRASSLLMALANAFSVSKHSDDKTLHPSLRRSASTNITRTLRVGSVKNRKSSMSNNSRDEKHGRPILVVADDMVHTSYTRTSGGSSMNSTRTELTHQLKLSMTPPMDKVEFNRQMDLTRVLGKEGKEPFRWDWAIISEMLEFAARHPDRISEAYKTKWIKRISGFYRCSVEEKGYFVNLDWDSANLHYLEYACNLYTALIENDMGMSFLYTDRRGVLFFDISRELNALVDYYLNPKLSSGINIMKNVFRSSSVNQSMTHELFCLIGRVSNYANGKKLLESTQLYHQLSNIGHIVALDYMSRNAITSLIFTDNGFISKNLLQIWTTSNSSSKNLVEYCQSLLRSLVRSRSKDACGWAVQLMIEQLIFDTKPAAAVTRCLEETAQDRDYLKIIIKKQPNINLPCMNNLCIRFLALPEGYKYLQSQGWIEKELELWKTTKSIQYTTLLESSLAKALNRTYISRLQLHHVSPIPVSCLTFSNHIAAPSGQLYPDGGVDVEGLLRIPWNIELKITSPSNALGEYIKVDAYFDSSELASTGSNDMTSDLHRIVRVKGVVLDARGIPSPYPVPNDKTLSACLLCGINPVHRDGRVYPTQSVATPEACRSQIPVNSLQRRRQVAKASFGLESIGHGRVLNHMRSSLTGDSGDVTEFPITYQVENLQDWSTCKPSARQSRQIELGNGRFAVEVPGDPVVWIFSRSSSNSSTAKSSTHYVYLVEVHYVMRLQTGQSMFLPMPRHMYGELARTTHGRQLLASNNIIDDLVRQIRDENLTNSTRRAALWSIGHIGATEAGFNDVYAAFPFIVPYCIDIVTTSPNYTLRATSFSVLGLFSRTEAGSRQLTLNQWDCAPVHNIPLSIPRDMSVLFQRVKGESVCCSCGNLPPGSVVDLSATTDELEREILTCIAKLPGQIMYKDNFAKLQQFHKTHSDVFSRRSFYIAVHKVLSSYSFKLSIRRAIINMFSATAKRSSD